LVHLRGGAGYEAKENDTFHVHRTESMDIPLARNKRKELRKEGRNTWLPVEVKENNTTLVYCFNI